MTLSAEVPVSVCTQRQSQNDWLVVMENVQRISASLSFSQNVSKSLLSNVLFLFYSISNSVH